MFAGAVGCGESAGAVVPGTVVILRKVSAARNGVETYAQVWAGQGL